ncbi:MAG: DUF3592 domain-containing protein, partial [Burkholderiales bacterium]|nr:DUF3592 domain-containing protein [Anaerolineae bacterium]
MFGDLFNNIGMLTPFIVAVPFLIIALFFIDKALRGGGQAKRAVRDWQTTNARVLAAQIEARQTRSQNGVSTSYYPVIVYEYEVGGRWFQG